MRQHKFENKADKRIDERRWMVETQLVPQGIKDESVLESMMSVPRHRFVPYSMEDYAYYDEPLRIGEGQTISQPYIVALMAEALIPKKNDIILEIGTGSGYSAAVLSRIVKKVYTIERHKELANQAQSRFEELGYKNIEILIGDGTKGWPEKAPFDGIIVTAGGPSVPQSLFSQLAVGGHLVIPVGEHKTYQDLIRITHKSKDEYVQDNLGRVKFVPLIGAEGWHTEINHGIANLTKT